MPPGMSFEDVMSFINSISGLNQGPDMSQPQVHDVGIPQIEPGIITTLFNHYLQGAFTPANQVGGGQPPQQPVYAGMQPQMPTQSPAQAVFNQFIQSQSAFNATPPQPGVGSPAQYMNQGGTP